MNRGSAMVVDMPDAAPAPFMRGKTRERVLNKTLKSERAALQNR
jgi:hypothetical protein